MSARGDPEALPYPGGAFFMPPVPAGQHGLYGKEPFSVSLPPEGDSGRFSDLGVEGLTGYTEKKWFPYKPLPVPKTSIFGLAEPGNASRSLKG